MNFENGLPKFCFSTNHINDEVILIKRGELGFYQYYNGAFKGEEKASELNAKFGLTAAQIEAMEVDSMYGWDLPGANPEMYDEEGMPRR